MNCNNVCRDWSRQTLPLHCTRARNLSLTFQIFKHSDPVLASGDRESGWRGDRSIAVLIKKERKKEKKILRKPTTWLVNRIRVPAGSARDRTPACAPLLDSFSSCFPLFPFLVYHHSN